VWGFAEAFTISRFLAPATLTTPISFRGLIDCNGTEEGQKHQRPARYARLYLCSGDHRNILMPVGRGTWPLVDDRAVHDSLRAMETRIGLMTSVCTGSALLAKAGLLDEKPAATNHEAFGWVAQQGPRALWNSVSRRVDAGKYMTSGGGCRHRHGFLSCVPACWPCSRRGRGARGRVQLDSRS
jgi:hypothetical protein